MTTLEELIKVTQRSCASTKYQTGCIIKRVDGRHHEILAKGWSHKDNGALNKLYSVHAEIHALSKLTKRVRENFIFDAYVYTIYRKTGSVVNSCPCYACIVALKSAGARCVFFSNGNGNQMEMINLQDEQFMSSYKVYRCQR